MKSYNSALPVLVFLICQPSASVDSFSTSTFLKIGSED